MRVHDIYSQRMKYSLRRKTRDYAEKWLSQHRVNHRTFLKINPAKSIDVFFETFRPFVEMVLKGTLKDVRDTTYFQYLIAHLNPVLLMPLTEKGINYAVNKAQNTITLINDIDENGLKDPLDMWYAKGQLKIIRGYRRLVILEATGTPTVRVRVWPSEEIYYRNQKGRIPSKWKRRFSA